MAFPLKRRTVFENFPLEVIKETFNSLKKQLIDNQSFFEASKILNSLLTDVLQFSVKKEKAP